ncbi:uncharacterized protein LOC142764963 [Rhipicephalus microplus]|uniref:uncharacterized protein LOC142764963 n=1 Tax=Rhipicephalus microplus TaxID=6941 RepID=UPI003F6B3ABC
MVKTLRIALALVVLRSPPLCSPGNDTGEPKWVDVDVKDNDKLKALAQDALMHTYIKLASYYVVVEMLSAQTMNMTRVGVTRYNVTYKTSPTNCTLSGPFNNATCKPTADKAEKQCSTTFLEMPSEEYSQIQDMMCFDIYYEK